MQVIVSFSTDPFFNLAAEEFLLKNYRGDLLYLYVNKPSIIVGKHQNLLAEINYRYAFEHHIILARRISGGGTVYHDEGNLNYAFFTSAPTGSQVNFQKYLNLVIEVLRRVGITAIFEGKNNLRIDGYKISGNAGHVYKNIALHHGTLLVNANQQMLSESLRISEGLYIDKAVKSVRAKVANLCTFVPDLTIDKLIDTFCEVVQSTRSSFTLEDIDHINNLKKNKFETQEWVWNYSPPYLYQRTGTPWGNIQLEVEKGIIAEARIEYSPSWNAQLKGKRHHYESIHEFISVLGLPSENIWWFF
ncbi:MAG: lipoate--protein ligase [Bacteroidales bacterium]|nr:lipoate--protein ligase [Bacteroidales bacterium]